MDNPAGVDGGGRGGWCLATEIEWGAIDVAAARTDPELLMLVRRAALRAARRTVGLSHLLSALAADSVASALLARELHDSWKHFHALRSYLEVAEYSPAISELELEQHRRAAPQGTLRRADQAAARIAELLDDAARDGALFSLVSSRAADPALGKLADRIARDRQQHSLALAKYLAVNVDLSGEKTA